VLTPKVGPKPLVAFGMLAAAGGMVWLAQLGPHSGYASGVLAPLILAGIGLGLVIAPVINTGTFGVAPQDAGEASATVTVGQQLGASVRTSLLGTIFAAAVASYITAHLASARLIGRQALTGLALAHGYDIAFWWTAGIFAGGAVVGGALLRRGPLGQRRTPSPGGRPGDNGTSQGRPRSSGVMSLAQILGVCEGGDRRIRVFVYFRTPAVLRGPTGPAASAQALSVPPCPGRVASRITPVSDPAW